MGPLANRKQNSEAHDRAAGTARLVNDDASEGQPSKVFADPVALKSPRVILDTRVFVGTWPGGRRPGGSDSPTRTVVDLSTANQG